MKHRHALLEMNDGPPVEETWIWKNKTYTRWYGSIAVRYQPKNSKKVFWLYVPYSKKKDVKFTSRKRNLLIKP